MKINEQMRNALILAIFFFVVLVFQTIVGYALEAGFTTGFNLVGVEENTKRFWHSLLAQSAGFLILIIAALTKK